MLRKIIEALVEQYGAPAVQRTLDEVARLYNGPTPSEVDAHAQHYLGSISRLDRIKALRQITGWGLRKCKYWCDEEYGYPN